MTTIRTQANLVVVDVTAVDGAGHAVQGLRSGDFILSEQGQPQTIRSFEEHAPSSQPLLIETPLQLPPGNFTNYTPTPATGALDILLVDSLNTPLDAQGDLNRQLDDYIKTASPTHQLAIFALSSRLTLLQGFTTDPAVLREALKSHPPRSSPALENVLNNSPAQHLSDAKQFGDGRPDGQYSGTSVAGADRLAASSDKLRTAETRFADLQLKSRVQLSLDALNSLGHYLAGLPGRKNLIWFSGGFPLRVAPNSTLTDSLSTSADFGRQLRDTVNTLTRAQVAVYPVDARGLSNAPQYDASARGGTDATQFANQLKTFNEKAAEEHSTMEETAYGTGGRAFYNSNGLKQAVQTVIETGDNYYTLSYVPTHPPAAEAFHNITIKLQGTSVGRGLKLSYRRGFYGDPNFDKSKKAPTAAPTVASYSPSFTAVRVAMTHGAPPSTEILLKALVLPTTLASAPAEKEPTTTTIVSSASKSGKGRWRNYVVDVVIPPSQVLGPVANGSAPADLELVLHCYDADGQLVSAASGSLRIHVPQANILELQQEGLRMRQVISTPDHGEYFLRIGAHDLLTNRIGSFELPLASVRNLPPAL